MSTRRKKPAPAPVPVVQSPPLPPCPPEWKASRRWDELPQHSALNLRQLVQGVADGEYFIPSFQRPYVWTDAQVIRLMESLMEGYHIGSLLLWERPASAVPDVSRIGGMEFTKRNGWNKCIVIDGQQRLTALAMVFLSGRFAFDFTQRRIVTDVPDGPDVIGFHRLLSLSVEGQSNRSWAYLLEWEKGTEHGIYKWEWLDQLLDAFAVSTVRLGARLPAERVVESYRRLATEGTPMDPAHLAEGLARFEAEMVTKETP